MRSLENNATPWKVTSTPRNTHSHFDSVPVPSACSLAVVILLLHFNYVTFNFLKYCWLMACN
jgi:hypothetical protein